MRCPLVIGNWKMHGSKDMTFKLINSLSLELSYVINCHVVIVPPVVYLEQAKRAISGTKMILGAQNVDVNLSGAFTGEISIEMLKDIGVQYVIVGHSERRIYHGETDEFVAKKFAIVKSSGLIPVLCIGENELENKMGKTEEVCKRQIDAVLEIWGDSKAFKHSVVAYEPIWAIGSGKFPPSNKVELIHKFIRSYISKKDLVLAEELVIQYGGSLVPENASDFFKQPNIDGALVGKASLRSDFFSMIVRKAEKYIH